MPNDMNEVVFQRASSSMSDGAARICRLYGLSPLLGRLYTALFLSTEPQSLEALCAAVGAAKSTVSVTLRKLEGAKLVRRLPPRSDRRDYYEIIGDPWAVLADWSKHYFTPELDMLRETSTGVLEALEAGDTVLRARLDTWRDFAEVIAAALSSTARQQPVPKARRIAITLEGEKP